MAEFNDIQAHELADMCLGNAEFSAGMNSLMQDLKDKDISLGAFNKKIRKMRRDTTGITSGVALSTGVLADQVLYSALSIDAFGDFVLVSRVEDHKSGVYSAGTSGVRSPQVGDYFEVHTSGMGGFSVCSIVQFESHERSYPLFKLINGNCQHDNAKGKQPGAYSEFDTMKHLPNYKLGDIGTPEPVPTASQIRQSLEIDIKIKQPKEIIMKPSSIIATQINVFGSNAASLDDDTLFDQVTRVEAEIAKLGKCENKPKKLVAKIEEMKSQLKALVDYIDSRD